MSDSRGATVRLELLIGREVLGPDGHGVGRIEEVLARPEDDGWTVVEFHIGAAALLERLSARFSGQRPRGYKVPWQALDLSNPLRPRLTKPLEELQRL